MAKEVNYYDDDEMPLLCSHSLRTVPFVLPMKLVPSWKAAPRKKTINNDLISRIREMGR